MFHILLSFILLISLNAFSKNSDAESIALFKAKMFASRATIGNYNLLSKNDQNLLKSDLKKIKSSNPIVNLKGTLVTVNIEKQKMTFDFKDIQQKNLIINNRKVNVEKYIPYVQSIVLIKDIFTPKSVIQNLLLPEVFADEGSWWKYWYAYLISSESHLADLTVPNASLEETIIQTYQAEFSRDPVLIDPNLYELFYDASLLNFTCKGKQLVEIGDEIGFYVSRGNKIIKNNTLLSFSADGSVTGTVGIINAFNKKNDSCAHTLIEINSEDATAVNRYCEIKADKNGFITESKDLKTYDPDIPPCRKCPAIGTTISEIGGDMPIFGDFPKVAQACCKKEGCYEKVESAIRTLLTKNVRSKIEKRTRGTR